MLSQKSLDELKIIMREDYKKDLTDTELKKIANSLVKYFEVLLAINKQNYESKKHTKPKKMS